MSEDVLPYGQPVGPINVGGLVYLFKILADATRLHILTALKEKGAMCVHDLTALLRMSQPAVSAQLRVLRAARLVESRRRGRERIYSLRDEHVFGVLSQGEMHVVHSARRRA